MVPYQLEILYILPWNWMGELGYVLLEKGITERYKINHFAHGEGNFRNGVIESNGQKYLLFIGRNTFQKLQKSNSLWIQIMNIILIFQLKKFF